MNNDVVAAEQETTTETTVPEDEVAALTNFASGPNNETEIAATTNFASGPNNEKVTADSQAVEEEIDTSSYEDDVTYEDEGGVGESLTVEDLFGDDGNEDPDATHLDFMINMATDFIRKAESLSELQNLAKFLLSKEKSQE